MRVPYVPCHSPSPLPMLGGSHVLPRPAMAVRVVGPTGSLLCDGILDTGADETVFELRVAAAIGVDLTGAPERKISLVGRPAFRCQYAQVLLRITDGVQETYEWPAIVGFVPIKLHRPLLGHAGFLQFFDVEFRGADHEVILLPNRTFSGRRI